MGIFGTTKKQTVQKKTASQAVTAALRNDRDLTSIIKKPRITEKAMLATEKNVYVFEIASNATKYDVAAAVKQIFNVVPVKVHTVTKRPTVALSRMRGKKKVSGIKKAYVYLKEGDRIQF